MFYAQFVLAKKGPLSRIWLAAHLEERLKRKDVADTDLQQAITEVLRPRIKISLRTTGFLLFGICRIHNQKVTYLLLDAYHIRDRLLHLNFKKPTEKKSHPAGQQPPLSNLHNETMPEASVYELDGTLINPQDFAHPPGPLVNSRANVNDITLHENEDEQTDMLAIIDNMELEGDLDTEFQRAQERLRSFRENSEDPNRMIPIPENENMDIDMMIEQARRQSETMNISSQPVLDPSETPKRPYEDVAELDRLINFVGEDHIDDTSHHEYMPPLDDEVPMEIDGDPGMNSRESLQSQGSLVLETLTDSQIRAQEIEKRRPRRRRPKGLLYDEDPELDDDLMLEWQSEVSDIQKPVELAAPTKLLMKAQMNGDLQRIWNNPGTDLYRNDDFWDLYQECLVPQLKTRLNDPQEFIHDETETTDLEIRHSIGLVDEPEPEQPNPALDITLQNPDDFPIENPRADHSILNFENDENVFANTSLEKDLTLDEQRDQSLLQASQTSSAMGEMEVNEVRREISVERHKIEEAANRLMDKIEKEWTKQEKKGETKMAEFRKIIQWQPSAKILAREFYALLELTTMKPIEIKQTQPYGPIFLRPPSHQL
ncbi:unnamed protein product [Bursaphelenchus xylophilus]|uniref:(pine wood nematode) hypothetical protein n=1 Tax=Bursaphelenchus xylophilus TaxID=6326 RepID=A0A1I7S8V3_BURXY|nr:unnamed protein product [Bursaphelenchus xylophilus]CAG9085904.1 unnamed protein product [Bursaphelenchus xylophilus]